MGQPDSGTLFFRRPERDRAAGDLMIISAVFIVTPSQDPHFNSNSPVGEPILPPKAPSALTALLDIRVWSGGYG